MTAPDRDEVSIVQAFNDAITRRDLDALTSLMTPTHRFVDASGGTVVGRTACEEAWRGFFASFPDYRNVFTSVEPSADGVVAHGYSECADARLAGPAVWRAVVRDGRVDLWHVADAP